MVDRDRMGRRRRPEQERGLRPLHPPLPEEWNSKPLRLAMSEADWARLEALVGRLAPHESTKARAYGRALSILMSSADVEIEIEPADPLDWMDWERRKTLRLLWKGR